MRFAKNINENNEIIALLTYEQENPLIFSEKDSKYWSEIDETTYLLLKKELDKRNEEIFQDQIRLVEMIMEEEIGSDIIKE